SVGIRHDLVEKTIFTQRVGPYELPSIGLWSRVRSMLRDAVIDKWLPERLRMLDDPERLDQLRKHYRGIPKDAESGVILDGTYFVEIKGGYVGGYFTEDWSENASVLGTGGHL